jgi:hypothetical protein
MFFVQFDFCVQKFIHFVISLSQLSITAKKKKKMFHFFLVCADEISDSLMHEISELPPANTGRHYNVGPMLPETRTVLEHLYSPFNRQLAGMLSDQSFLWQ